MNVLAGYDMPAVQQRRGIRAGSAYKRPDDDQLVPGGTRHAVYEGERVSICGEAVRLIRGGWADNRPINVRDCPRCTDAVGEMSGT